MGLADEPSHLFKRPSLRGRPSLVSPLMPASAVPQLAECADAPLEFVELRENFILAGINLHESFAGVGNCAM